MRNSTVTEHMCSEVMFVEKVAEGCDMPALVQLGRNWGKLSKMTQQAIPMFVDICKNMVSNIETPKEHEINV